VGLGATQVVALAYAAFSLFSGLELQLVTFILYAVWRTWLFATVYAYVSFVFGFDHFGVLSGIIMAASGAVSVLQLPITFYARAAGGNHVVGIVQLASLGILCVIPLFARRKRLRKRGARTFEEYVEGLQQS
jgi:hypothetical protein